MPDYVIAPPACASVPVQGGGVFPVRRIFCVGRNYAEHAREMGGGHETEPPFFFMKPADAIVASGGEVPYPPRTSNLHHEIEMVVALGRSARDVRPEEALDLVLGYAAGIDMTRRDLQAAFKKIGRPWEMAKSFDHSAPIGSIAPAMRIGHPSRGAITLSVNGTPRQRGDIADMIWSVPQVLAELSGFVELRAGDLVFTGTPAGVGPVARGDRLDGTIEGVGSVSITIG